MGGVSVRSMTVSNRSVPDFLTKTPIHEGVSQIFVRSFLFTLQFHAFRYQAHTCFCNQLAKKVALYRVFKRLKYLELLHQRWKTNPNPNRSHRETKDQALIQPSSTLVASSHLPSLVAMPKKVGGMMHS